MRYHLFGYVMAEAPDSFNPTSPEEMTPTEPRLIYSTDSREEAKKIVKSGGYQLNGVHYAIQWAEDSVTNGIYGNKPATTQAYKQTTREALHKDQLDGR